MRIQQRYLPRAPDPDGGKSGIKEMKGCSLDFFRRVLGLAEGVGWKVRLGVGGSVLGGMGCRRDALGSCEGEKLVPGTVSAAE